MQTTQQFIIEQRGFGQLYGISNNSTLSEGVCYKKPNARNRPIYLFEINSTWLIIGSTIGFIDFGNSNYEAAQMPWLFPVIVVLSLIVISIIKIWKLHQQAKLLRNILILISHDIRGMVTSFSTFPESIAFLLEKNEVDRAFQTAEHAGKISKRLNKSIQDLLSWSISYKQSVVLEESVLSVRSFLMEVLDSIVCGKDTNNVEIVCQEDVWICTDRIAFEIIVRNIVENAVLYSSKGSNIKIEISGYNGFVEMKVRNAAVGITDANLSSLRKVLNNGKVHRKFGSKVGVGLYIIHFLAKDLGGRVYIKYNQVGAEISIVLKLPQTLKKRISI